MSRLELLYHWNSEEGIGEYVSQALSQATSQFQDDSAALLGRSIQVLVHQLVDVKGNGRAALDNMPGRAGHETDCAPSRCNSH